MAKKKPSSISNRPIRVLPPPVLMVRRNNRSQPLQLTKVDIKATIVGHLAETKMTMTFYNPNNAVMEGDLYFPLPQGATVSGYALDINGVMVDGVVVDKHHGRQVFEAEVRKGVDPGLIEWTKGSNFKTRIFPIPRKGTRTIRVDYVSEVTTTNDSARYYLPLSFRRKVKRLSMRVEVVKAAAPPTIAKGGPNGMSFKRWSDNYVATAKLSNTTLTKDLYVSLPKISSKPVRVERGPDGQVYFSIRDNVRAPAIRNRRRQPRSMAIYWDASLSREKVSHAEEFALLKSYFARNPQPMTVHLVVFRNRAERTLRFQLPRQMGGLMSALRLVSYDGGTQLGAAVPRRMPRVDVSLMFTDGISNFGDENPRSLKTPVYVINNAAIANHAALRYLSMRTGGAYFNLRNTKASEAVKSIGRPVFSFMGADVSGAQIAGVYPKVRVPVAGAFYLAGKLRSTTAKITLKYGYGNRVLLRRPFTIKVSDAGKGNMLRRYWAQKKVDDLLIFAERNEEAISKVGREYSLVTPNTSLIVLENLGQYVQHKIRPPAMLAKMRVKWDSEMKRRASALKIAQTSKLTRIIKLWEQKVAWWSKRYKYPKNYRVATSRPKKTAASADAARVRRPSLSVSSPRGNRSPEAKKAKKKGQSRPQPSIKLKAWDPDTPYIRAVKAAPRNRQYAVYLIQRKLHGSAPAFYLDMANYFRRQKRTELALRILSNLAELELENPALMRVLAHRLAQVGQLDLSIKVFDAVRKLRPEEPQSFRDLALVLARRGDKRRYRRVSARKDYSRALELLSHVVMERWSRFDQIEVIALTELNNILPKARRLGLRKLPVDKRLIKKLDMDIRIVMSWDADNTDMDLHVVEPSNEEAYYSHNRTKIGGMVSRDFTRGYGPEVYSIRRAMRGRYKIRTKFYGTSAAKLSGAVTLQVDVYTNFGRANQKRKSITLRLTKKKETFTVGTIRF